MKLIFVRHGEPDYEKDCLTQLGHKQAAAAAERLERENLDKIYASPMGRAQETASYTAKMTGLEINTLDFMHEISWGGEGLPENGHPWTLSDRLIQEENFDFYGKDWREHPYFKGNAATEYYDRITDKFAGVLESHGYRQDGGRFMCDTDRDETVAVFSHGGSSGSVIAGLLSLPFPYVLSEMTFDFTSIVILEFPVNKGEYVKPRLKLFNDCEHIRGISGGLVIQKEVDRK
ncbi:MAG: histidine phosphatase family protein [Lachnospiraceae bacterium]|nr:histidine phosphatase family protein [Lachnospiraceae bacterium]